jgi:hypothetical protein
LDDRQRLIDAVRSGDVEAVRTALDGGSEPLDRDGDDWSALDWAAGTGDAEIVHLLLEHGADPLQTGEERRTPYDIALAAGRLEAARLLRDAEERADPSRAGTRAWEPYCRGYLASELRAFDGWHEPGDGDLADDAVVFLHTDLTVTASMWPGEDVIFDERSPAWEAYCRTALAFQPPDDFDLVPDEG